MFFNLPEELKQAMTSVLLKSRRNIDCEKVFRGKNIKAYR